MKKFIRTRKTFSESGSQTRDAEVYILDEKRGGLPDKEGGGLVKEFPSKLINRLRGDLNFAARVQQGNAKINGKLKEEMAVITRDAYVSKGKARKRLGEVMAEKAARGRESIQFFKHQLSQQKVSSLRAARARTEGENLALQTKVERQNHEISTHRVALQAMGAVSKFDEEQHHEKDHMIEGLKAVIGTLASQLQEERQRSEFMRGQRNETQDELFHAYSALGRLAMVNGHASDKHMIYDVKQPVYKEQGRKSLSTLELNKAQKIKDNDADTLGVSSASSSLRKVVSSPSSSSTTPTRTPNHMKYDNVPRTGVTSHKLTRSKQRARPQSAFSSALGQKGSLQSKPRPMSARQKRRMLATRSHYGRRSHEWHRPNSRVDSSRKATGAAHDTPHRGSNVKAPILTPVSHQGASVFAKQPFTADPSPFALTRDPSDSGDSTLRIRAGATDCYSPAQLASFLQSTTALPQELRPPGYFPPPVPLKNWETLLNEEDDRLTGKAKELRKHRYVRWRPVPTEGHEVPPTIRPSPLRAMVKEKRQDIINAQIEKAKADERLNSLDHLSDHLQKSRARKLAREGPGATGEREDGVEEGPNIDHCATDESGMVGVVTLPSSVSGGKEQIMRVASTLEEEARIRSLETEVNNITALYSIGQKHCDYPNVNKLGLFEFDDEYGTYRYRSSKLPSAVVAELRRKEREEKEREQKENKRREEQKKWEEMVGMDVDEDPQDSLGDGLSKRERRKIAKEKIRAKMEKRNLSTTRKLTKTKAQLEAENCRSISADPTADRAKSFRRRPKSATLTRKSEKKMLDRLRRSSGSRFFGPGMGFRKRVKKMRTSGSVNHLRQKIAKKLDEAARKNTH